MSDTNDQDKSHPLEQVTGERDVHPEEESGQQDEAAGSAEEDDTAQADDDA
ncbi:hypothetical protein ACIF8T_36855 [Streptomyces sp. NPDC085946]|uniref:hypothetical protein n=1 Tax=Streptomyces sp. NPDC085946 TaxID=3365744 RepID=UPI0037D04719